jgi:hypothetical protein
MYKNFTISEASHLVGKSIKANSSALVPVGTLGTILDFRRTLHDGCVLHIQWANDTQDWLTKKELRNQSDFVEENIFQKRK